jgi:hypothetical protein
MAINRVASREQARKTEVITISPAGGGWWHYHVTRNGRLIVSGSQGGTRAEALRTARYEASQYDDTMTGHLQIGSTSA